MEFTTPEKRSNYMALRVTAQEKEWLKSEAEKLGLDISKLVRMAIKIYIQRLEEEGDLNDKSE